jgi:hypothetical protein
MAVVPLDPACTDTAPGAAESTNDGALGIELRSLIKGWPAGVPHPVARSKPAIATNPVLPVAMSCRSLA